MPHDGVFGGTGLALGATGLGDSLFQTTDVEIVEKEEEDKGDVFNEQEALIYAPYKPVLKLRHPHPGIHNSSSHWLIDSNQATVVEAATLASADLPASSYEARLPPKVCPSLLFDPLAANTFVRVQCEQSSTDDDPALSTLQLETVKYVGERHQGNLGIKHSVF